MKRMMIPNLALEKSDCKSDMNLSNAIQKHILTRYTGVNFRQAFDTTSGNFLYQKLKISLTKCDV